MTNKEFINLTTPYNMEYLKIFGYIPRITDFSCGREEYVEALKRAVEEKTKIENLLPPEIPVEADGIL